MKCLITGGDGFIGSHNAAFILDNYPDSEILLIDNLSRSKGNNYQFLKSKYGDRVTLVKEDIRNLSKIKDHFKNVDRVYHMAAQVTMTKSLEDPLTDYEINSTGTINVLEASRKFCDGAPIVYCSTNKVYGDLIQLNWENDELIRRKLQQNSDFVIEDNRYSFKDKNMNGISETKFDVSPETANCPYGSSKLAGELWMKNYFDTYGLKTVRVRMSCIYGTRQFGNEDQGWLSWFTIRALLGKNIVIYGDGKQVRDVLYCEDQARAFDLVSKKSKCYGDVFNLGGGVENTLSLLELLDLINEFSGKRSEIKYSNWRHGDQKVFISDISKIKKFTGFVPEISIREGVRRLINWTKNNLEIIKDVSKEIALRDL